VKRSDLSEYLKRVKLGIYTVYFLEFDGHVKIGVTLDVEKRIKALSTSHHGDLKLIGTIDNVPRSLERELHKRFARHRANGEWFKLVPEIRAYIDDATKRMSDDALLDAIEAFNQPATAQLAA
jgi:hypothetical protein